MTINEKDGHHSAGLNLHWTGVDKKWTGVNNMSHHGHFSLRAKRKLLTPSDSMSSERIKEGGREVMRICSAHVCLINSRCEVICAKSY